MAKKSTGKTQKKPAGTTKKRTNNRKRKAPGKNQSRRSGNYGVLLVLILALVSMGVVALYFLGDFKTATDQHPPVAQKENTNDTKEIETKDPGTKTDEPQNQKVTEEVKESVKRNENIPTPTKNRDQYYFTRSFDFSWPEYSLEDQIIEHSAFTLAYDEAAEQAAWVAYEVKIDQGSGRARSSAQKFTEDPLITTGSATLKDYNQKDYVMGQLAPAENFTWSAEAFKESFHLSNVSPQKPGFNQGLWKKLDLQIIEWAKKEGNLYVVTGPIFDRKTAIIGRNKVKIPSAFFKIVLDINEPELKAIGFILPHIDTEEHVMNFAVTVDDIEKTTGLNFFPAIPGELQDELESSLNKSQWP